MSKRKRACVHDGPYRAVQGALGHEAAGSCVVMCMMCGGFQYAAGGSFAAGACGLMRASPSASDRWFGTAAECGDLPHGASLLLLSGPMADLVEAHKIAQQGERHFRESQRDGSWFLGQGMVSPWLESKPDQRTGDLLVRPRAG